MQYLTKHNTYSGTILSNQLSENCDSMIINIVRQGRSIAEDVGHFETIVVNSIEDLQDFLRNYLPTTNGTPYVWVVGIYKKDNFIPILYYYSFYLSGKKKMSYFVDSHISVDLHDNNTLYCDLYTEERLSYISGIPSEGSLLFKVRKIYE